MSTSNLTFQAFDPSTLREPLAHLRGNPEHAPDGSIVIPVNAQADLDNLLQIVRDLTRYGGEHTFEVIPVINNYPPDTPPAQIETFRAMGLEVVAIPNARRPGEKVGFSARIPGLRAARSPITIHFDADCRLPDPTALLNFYVNQLRSGNVLAYTPVHFFDLPEGLAVRCRVAFHHTARWMKRNLLRIPTARGSNYAIDRSTMLQLYESGKVTEDFQVGLNVKALGARSAYSGARELAVLTSGRMFHSSWKRLLSYARWRLHFNIRMLRDTRAARPREL